MSLGGVETRVVVSVFQVCATNIHTHTHNEPDRTGAIQCDWFSRCESQAGGSSSSTAQKGKLIFIFRCCFPGQHCLFDWSKGPPPRVQAYQYLFGVIVWSIDLIVSVARSLPRPRADREQGFSLTTPKTPQACCRKRNELMKPCPNFPPRVTRDKQWIIIISIVACWEGLCVSVCVCLGGLFFR